MYSVVNIPSQIVHKVFTIVTSTALKTKLKTSTLQTVRFCITSNKTCHISRVSVFTFTNP